MKLKIVIAALLLFLAAGLVVFLHLYGQEDFVGSRIADRDTYALDMERMNGTDLHTWELKAGDALRIRFETEKGSMHLEIKAPDGTLLYAGNGRETKTFTVNIPVSGVYTVIVEARHAKGNLCISTTD